jgi:hypothetical protein
MLLPSFPCSQKVGIPLVSTANASADRATLRPDKCLVVKPLASSLRPVPVCKHPFATWNPQAFPPKS